MRTDVCRLSIFRTEHLHRYEEGSTLTGIIYVHRISDTRFDGISGRNFAMFRKLCGESALKNVVLVTNMWREDSQVLNEARERELINGFFKPVLDKGAQVTRHNNTIESAHDILLRIVGNRQIVLQIQRELVDEQMVIIDTAAGGLINQELREQIRRYQAELKELREEMHRALKAKHEGRRHKLQEVDWDLEGTLEKINKAGADHAAEKEKERAEAEISETGQVKTEYDRDSAILINRLQRAPNASAADRAVWEQEIKRLRDRTTIPICL